MTRKLLLLSVLARPSATLAVALAVAAPGAGAAQPRSGGEILDRIVAVVDEDPILESDLRRVLGLGLVERGSEESEEALRRRVLDRMIEQRLRYHELDRFGFSEVPLDEIEEQVESLRESFGGAEAFARQLEELGMDEQAVRQLVARQLMVLIFVEERLGPRVFVDLEQIRAYYDEVLAPQAAERGEELAPLAELREPIREVLKQKLLNEELARWTEELRREADVEDYLDTVPDAPPDEVVHSRRPG